MNTDVNAAIEKNKSLSLFSYSRRNLFDAGTLRLRDAGFSFFRAHFARLAFSLNTSDPALFRCNSMLAGTIRR